MCNKCFNGMWCIEEQKVRVGLLRKLVLLELDLSCVL
jgi:hypothetical protein